MAGRSFAATERFLSEVSARKLRPAYVLVGDEVFFRDRCRTALLEHLVSPDLRDFSLHDIDLTETGIGEILDRARTPSLMAPATVGAPRRTAVRAPLTAGAYRRTQAHRMAAAAARVVTTPLAVAARSPVMVVAMLGRAPQSTPAGAVASPGREHPRAHG